MAKVDNFKVENIPDIETPKFALDAREDLLAKMLAKYIVEEEKANEKEVTTCGD